MTTVTLSPPPVLQFFSNQGTPLVGGSLLTQVGGINTATYQDAAGTTPLPNPIPLNSRGEVSNSLGLSSQLFLINGNTYTFTLKDALGNTINTYTSVVPPDTGVVASLASTISASVGAGMLGYAISNIYAQGTVGSKLQETISVFDAGAMTTAQVADIRARTLTQDVTSAINVAISVAVVLKRKLFFPAGTYKVTANVSLPNGSQLLGEKGEQLDAGFGVDPGGTIISFSPTVAATDLFTATGTTSGGFRMHYSIEGMHLTATTTNANNGINWDHVIYGRIETVSVDGFVTGLNCNGTIDNRIVNCHFAGSAQAVNYVGNNETTDVFEQCTFYAGETLSTPIGVNFNGASIGIRFNSCLFEQLGLYGMQIAKDCQAITVVDAYAEDVPFTNVATGAMFRVGYTGTTLSSEYQLAVIGGKYAGRNAGTVGSFLDCDATNGVTLMGVTHSRFTNIINTTANTRVNSIGIALGSGISWTNYTNHAGTPGDRTRITGVFPSGVNNTGSQSQTARFMVAAVQSLTAYDASAATLVVDGGTVRVNGAAFFPSKEDGTNQQTAGIWAGAGVPSNTFGSNGHYYFRSDTPGTANQRVYVKSAGAWAGIL